MEDLQKKIDEARQKRAEKEAAKATKVQELDLKKTLEKEERLLKNLDILEELEERHGENKIAHVTLDDGRMIVVRTPTRMEFHKFSASKGSAIENAETLIARCRVYPDAGEYAKMLDDQPGLLGSLNQAISHLTGLDVEHSGKK